MRRRSPAPTTSATGGASKRARLVSGPTELASLLRPAHKMLEVPLPPQALALSPVLEWDLGADRPKLEGCARGDGSGGLLISNGRQILLLQEDGAHAVVLEGSPQPHRMMGTVASGCKSGRALVLYEFEVGRVVKVALPTITEEHGRASASDAGASALASEDPPRPDIELILSLSEPHPKPNQLLFHPLHEGVVLARSKTHLQLIGPGPARQQSTKRELRAGIGCPQFTVSSLWTSGVVHPETGDVYFLDTTGASLFRWEHSPGLPRVSRVAEWEVERDPGEDPQHHAVDRLALGRGLLLAWGGRGRCFRLLRIDLGSWVVRTLDLLSQSGALFRRPKFHREVLRLSGDLLYMAVFRAEQQMSTTGRLERMFAADLSRDESAPGISELHSIDWASPAQPVSFRLSGAECVSCSPGPCCEEGHRREVLKVDRRVLCARSEYFRAMFGSDMREASAGVVDLAQEVRAPAFRCLVDYLHTDLIDPVKAVGHPGTEPADLPPAALLDCGLLCLDVAQLADRYHLLRLRRLAETFVHAYVLQLPPVPSVFALLSRAFAAGLEDVSEACLRVVAKSWTKIRSSYKKELETFVRADPTLATVMMLRCPTMALK